jgi:hypothetical protein
VGKLCGPHNGRRDLRPHSELQTGLVDHVELAYVRNPFGLVFDPAMDKPHGGDDIIWSSIDRSVGLCYRDEKSKIPLVPPLAKGDFL